MKKMLIILLSIIEFVIEATIMLLDLTVAV
jgi:hypothetical protein